MLQAIHRNFPRFAGHFWFVALCLFAFASAGADNQSALRAPSVQAPSLLFSFFRVCGAMGVVIAMFLGAAWVFRNWQRFSPQNGRPAKLNVLESRSLGPRHGLYVVGYQTHRYLVASAPNGITMLTALPEASADEPAPQPVTSPDFKLLLNRAFAALPMKNGRITAP